MPWALVELDANFSSNSTTTTPLVLQFLGRQRFTKSRKPFIKPAGFTPRGRSDQPAKQAAHDDKGEKDALRTPFSLPGGHTLQLAVDPPRLALPVLAAHAAGGVESADAPPSHRGRVLPVKPSQRQPSPRVSLPRGAGPAVPGLGLVAVDECSAWGAARCSAAFTPRSQALEDAKTAQRRNMANGCMKKLMDKNWAARRTAVEGLAELALLDNDSTAIDVIVQHLASKNDKARQAAIFAISRISSFQGNRNVAQHFLRLLGHTNPEVRQVAQAALGHIMTKGDETSKLVMNDIEALLHHPDRNVREAAVDAIVQVSKKGDKRALECLVTCFADLDWMVRHVALEASEQLLDDSLTSVLAVLGVLRNICQGPSASNVKSRVFASSTPAESVKACRTLVARISIPPSICCPPCKAAASTRYSGATASADSKSDTWHTGPFQQDTVCGQCVAAINRYIVQRELPKHFLAFCMGGHPRLGRESLVGGLDTSLLPVILGFCWPNSAVSLE